MTESRKLAAILAADVVVFSLGNTSDIDVGVQRLASCSGLVINSLTQQHPSSRRRSRATSRGLSGASGGGAA